MPSLTGNNALLAGCVWCLIALSSPAQAEDLTLGSNETVPVFLPQEPATIVVSNPAIADVTVRGTTLLFLGRNFGSTNVIVLDDEGGEVRNWRVNVINGDPYGVAVFKAGKGENFTCKRDCEPAQQGGGTAAATPPDQTTRKD